MNILRMNCWYLKQLPDNGCIVRNDRKQQYKLQAGGYPVADGPILKNSVSIFFTVFIDLWYNQFKRLNKGDGYTMNLFCEEIHKLEAEFKQCRKLLKKVVEEIVERKNGDRMQRNMPYFVRLVVDYFYDRMRKTKNLQYGDRTQNHGRYKNPYTKI